MYSIFRKKTVTKQDLLNLGLPIEEVEFIRGRVVIKWKRPPSIQEKNKVLAALEMVRWEEVNKEDIGEAIILDRVKRHLRAVKEKQIEFQRYVASKQKESSS